MRWAAQTSPDRLEFKLQIAGSLKAELQTTHHSSLITLHSSLITRYYGPWIISIKERALTSTMSRRNFIAATVASAAAAAMTHNAPAFAADDRPGYQIGCYTRPWAQFDYLTAMDAIAEAGFKYVGLMTTKGGVIISPTSSVESAAKVAEEAKKRGLEIPSAWGGDISVAKSIDIGIASLRRLIDNCAAAGVWNVLMGGTGDPKLYNAYYKAIAECCDYAAEKKVGITIKPHGGLNATGPQCRKTIELVNHKNFTLWYDPGNIFYYSDGKLDPAEDSATVNGIVSGMCVKDYQEPKRVDVTPGTGKVDFRAVLAKLRQGGFTRGPLIIETLAPGTLQQILAEARRAKAFVEGLIQ